MNGNPHTDLIGYMRIAVKASVVPVDLAIALTGDFSLHRMGNTRDDAFYFKTRFLPGRHRSFSMALQFANQGIGEGDLRTHFIGVIIEYGYKNALLRRFE